MAVEALTETLSWLAYFRDSNLWLYLYTLTLRGGVYNLNCPLPQQNASLLYKYTILGKNDQIKCNPPTLTLPPKFLWKLPWPYKYGYDMLVTAPRQMTAGGHSLISPFFFPREVYGFNPPTPKHMQKF